ncbi:tail fiber assembly protein [Pseudomonas phage 98PfluR60PP]|uniref:Tail fiber assembly protein n=1 Tax=Pseudomonas phage 98PfluR60PP TaxID=2163965 RepID=A0A2S1PFX2_9CAUD|nr:tail fiber assembly protein [Pseudomonas phage 98PfluR60PP]AWH15457.1 tail fiber assembly protein [Pseudomonas phage 98PfluR60PP]
MKIKLWADLVDWPLEASVDGDVITINGEIIDLSGIPSGYRLPGSAVGNKFFVETEYVERINGVLCFTLRLPVTWDSPEEFRNPGEPIIIEVTEGAVVFPNTAPIVELNEILEVPEDGGSIKA